MKRFFALLLIAMTVLALAACGTNNQETAPVTVTEAPTESPYLDTPVDEPEWTLAEGVLSLEDNDNIYAEGDDFLYFAFVGSTPDDMELRFRLDDVTAEMLMEQSPDNQYYIALNGERIGNAALSSDCTVAVISAKDAVTEITSLATKIRGLE